MSPEDKRRLEDMIDMFATPGWRAVVEDMETAYREHDRVMGIGDEKELYIRQGKLMAIAHVLGIETLTREALDEQEDAEII